MGRNTQPHHHGNISSISGMEGNSMIPKIQQKEETQAPIRRHLGNSFYTLVKMPGEKYWKIAVGLRIVSSKKFKTTLGARLHIWSKPTTLTVLTTIAIIQTKNGEEL